MTGRIDYLDLADLMVVARAVTGLAHPPVRDPGLLESALARPATSVFGQEAFPSLHEKAAALFHSLARNHPLADGNKRLAYMAAKIMYGLNGFHLRVPSVDEGDAFVRAVAKGDFEVPELAAALAAWTTPR
ncbi:type II toxin-antitoxin system death-on-curing family toxin [Glycomyces terrestris]|uniref:Type II toxin-antitoxin system death-on-curing family toxin n=1 Tax=Glycomyces terrestris TaxID=2493553 RepID=A0A426UTY6_9ACTN|nr:type II toxin-antitoxin system death-on-curing family toxin [Glycomyces terrestris]RRR97445.1 type II toxin-antitoxin system death-on-curing family toxin [Glycomyces terrestris]